MARAPKAKKAARQERRKLSRKRKRYEDATSEDRAANGWRQCAPRKMVENGIELETTVLKRVFHKWVNKTEHGISYRVPRFKHVPVWPE